MPERANDGSLTIAGWLSRTPKIIRYGIATSALTHSISIVLRAKKREFTVSSWYPFDAYTSPVFEVVAVVQVSDEVLNALYSADLELEFGDHITSDVGLYSHEIQRILWRYCSFLWQVHEEVKEQRAKSEIGLFTDF